MQKKLLAAVVASLVAGQAMAEIQPLSADQFTVGGEASVGGYYESEQKQQFYTGGTTALSINTSYKNGGIVGYVEVDLMAEYGADAEEDLVDDLDKAWIGYDFGFGTLSYGIENDTALDAVDGAGDMTYEFGMNAGDANDAFDVVKMQGSVSGFAYGVSYYETDDDSAENAAKQTGYNGYVGFEADKFNVYVGYEKEDALDVVGGKVLVEGEDSTVTTVAGNVDLGMVKLGANIWKEEAFDTARASVDLDGYYVSAASTFDALTLATGYGEVDSDIKEDSYKSFNVSGLYQMTSNTYVGLDIAYNMPEVEIKDTQEDETKVFLKVGYTF